LINWYITHRCWRCCSIIKSTIRCNRLFKEKKETNVIIKDFQSLILYKKSYNNYLFFNSWCYIQFSIPQNNTFTLQIKFINTIMQKWKKKNTYITLKSLCFLFRFKCNKTITLTNTSSIYNYFRWFNVTIGRKDTT